MDPDSLITFCAAVVDSARKDYQRGPTSQHYASAQRFLEAAGLLPHIEARFGQKERAA